ncbi:MAG: hypothetical protein IKU37_00505 [Candidatus Gastranaerophilales bacterium]|nr:hypothetical protein [Candidatus Gastranaerophilales bacterium]
MNMKAEINPYSIFKSYNMPSQETVNDKKKSHLRQIVPYVGSAVGVGAAILANKKMPKTKYKTINDVTEMLLMAGGANIGGVLAGSVGADKNSQKKKWKEAGFQVMNISIPMLMVSAALEICKNIKFLNNVPTKIIASIAGMTSGAMLATKITNATRKEGEPYRKYTIKDSIANFDDIVATIKIGFERILEYIPVDKILPFIYIYSGGRAGNKE